MVLQCIFVLIVATFCDPILDGFPVNFQLQGPTSFTPNSGASIVSGYILTMGFLNHQWLAVDIIGATEDILVVQQNPFYTTNTNDSFSGHIVTVSDYHLSNGALTADTITTDDLNAIGYMKSNNYSITVKRALSSHSGQDWDANSNRYGVTQVCFYTSNAAFDPTNWQGTSSVCSYFEVTNLQSTFRGYYLKDIKLNGYNVSMYGFIDGPYVTANVFYYHTTPLYTYNLAPAIILELGTAADSTVQDFNVYSTMGSQTGDYYGSDVTSIQKDFANNGFENNGLSATYQNTNASAINSNISGTNIKVTFNRNISTYDLMDKDLLSTFTFCIYIYSQGSIGGSLTDKYCDVVELSYSYPRMSMPVKQSSAAKAVFTLILLTVLLAIMM